MRPSFDEMQATRDSVREHYRGYDRWLKEQPGDVMRSRREEAEMIFRRVGITFAVYGAKDEDGSGTATYVAAPPYSPPMASPCSRRSEISTTGAATPMLA